MFEPRRRRFLEAMGEGAVALLQGARPATRSADTEYPFRQDSDFHYLTGFDHPCAVAVLRTDGGPPFTLFVQPRDPAAETWTGYRPGIEGARHGYGADEAHPIDDLEKELPGILERARRVFHVIGRDRRLDERIVDILEGMRLRSRLGLEPAEAIVDPRSILHEMRLVKEPDELAIMRRAADITAEGHHEAARLAHGGRREYELQAALEWVFRRRGAAGPAYGSIVGGGRNATILHYVQNDAELRDGELVLIDAGCELEGYASDVTRTYPVGGRFGGPARAVYEVVLEAQEASLRASHPGATLEDVHQASVRRLVEGMVALGLLEGDVEELVAREAYRPWYMHRTSHWLGLDVHDVGSYARDGKPRRLEPGMAFTVEPGLYVPADDENAPAGLRGIGVRIEDDVVVTEEGHENLTHAVPKRPEDVEAWVRDARS
ncbi:MAG: aminopeptidase P N-terminal domain-containing protein [Myxococcota bacterium]|nr:aminopeptidase P N-terminal domain-containing protein [Myxococcota bacterium]